MTKTDRPMQWRDTLASGAVLTVERNAFVDEWLVSVFTDLGHQVIANPVSRPEAEAVAAVLIAGGTIREAQKAGQAVVA
jgi:hypothetical protein